MDWFQEGTQNKEISLAEVENIVKVMDTARNSITQAEVKDHKKDTVYRLRVQQRKLKDELSYVLKQLNIPPASLYVFQSVLADDVVPDTTPETSDKTKYSSVRYRNIPISAVTELKEVAANCSGETFNRVMNLVTDITFLKSHIAKMEKDMEYARNARVEFDRKKELDPAGFKKLSEQFLAVSEIRGYVSALTKLVESYPDISTSDKSLVVTAEQFDRVCLTWRRYSRRLFKSVDNYLEKYLDEISEDAVDIFMDKGYFDSTKTVAERYGVSENDVFNVLSNELEIVFDKKEGTFKTRVSSLKLLQSIKGLLERREILSDQYTVVVKANLIRTTLTGLIALEYSFSILRIVLEGSLEKWSGGKSLVSSNRTVSKIIEKAKESVISPVRATVTSPLTRDAFVAGSLRDFSKSVAEVKKAKQFMEQAPNKIREALAKRAEEAGRDTMRKILLRRDLPTKNNRNGLAPVEDAVRAKVRSRYGNIPFEDEVNTGTDDKPEYHKEVYCQEVTVKDSIGAEVQVWKLKSDLAAQEIQKNVESENVN
jgi:hypothetical protein